MIYITQLIWIREGQEQVFSDFENVAIPIIAKHNGRLLFRVRPTPESVMYAEQECPYEIHLVSFDSQSDFDAFRQDDERNKFLHLKEQSVRSQLIIQGFAL